ncbi:putative 28S ribosomal protein S16, mitochondrial [Orchesella cincta]|uniref:Small ribosomal subunit protein bS16m n=1 Tax=Orchesella cincta TaxID=48709 RepID=A0A1D2N5R5_ORCCI|nr:putative 28S ribosomal protein S16, mitochondrial [Orchesella cincta]
MPLPSIGGGVFSRGGGPVIKLFLHGHANRPFFHIIITDKFAPLGTHPVEQLGTYDPMPNSENQKLLSLNIERTRYWMGQGAAFSPTASKLLGKAGFLPIYPETYEAAWRNRYKAAEEANKAAEAASEGQPSQPPSSSS